MARRKTRLEERGEALSHIDAVFSTETANEIETMSQQLELTSRGEFIRKAVRTLRWFMKDMKEQFIIVVTDPEAVEVVECDCCKATIAKIATTFMERNTEGENTQLRCKLCNAEGTDHFKHHEGCPILTWNSYAIHARQKQVWNFPLRVVWA